jgi:predicted RNase H-like HicB family nuclease/predicted RNA binding protein YcfA (HicA-like mRNA interferase family)
MKFKLIVEQDDDGLFYAYTPVINGCISQGKTKEEAIKNINNAIKGFMKIFRTYSMIFPPVYDETIKDLPVFSSEKLVEIFKSMGYEIDVQDLGHYFLRQRVFPHRIVTIPEYNAISKGALKNIIQQAGLSIQEFKNFYKKIKK